MASNFRIMAYRKSEDLYIKLSGDFDGSSAFELLNLLKKSPKNFRKIIIHTSNLNDIHPFGVQTFHRILSDLRGEQIRLFFAGEKANQISPKKDMCLSTSESNMPQNQQSDPPC